MTGSGERSALEPDLVPVHQRIRELYGRFTEGPLPSAEVKALRESIGKPRPGNRALLPARTIQTREAFDAYQREREAALAELADWIRSAASGSATELERLGERLRGLHDHHRLRFDPESVELGLPLEQTRTIARQLLRTGLTGTEIAVGLQLMTIAAEGVDAPLLRELALLGRTFGATASKALQRLEAPAAHQFALAMRTARGERWAFISALADAPRADFDALLETLSVREMITLLEMTADLQKTPKWLEGNEQLAAAVTAAAEDPTRLGRSPAAFVSLAHLRDEVRYGRSALLGWSRGQREQVIERFGAALTAPEVVESVERRLARRPDDSTAIWLHRQILDARRDGSGEFPAGIAVRVSVPPPDHGGDARTNLLIDGMPLVARVFAPGLPNSPERLLQGEAGLRAVVEPREIRLADATCDTQCCGALHALISRNEVEGRVEWETWRTLSAHRQGESFTFDAAAYDAEVACAAGDFTWEWPARRAARFLRERLRAEPELLSRWDCRQGWVSSWNRERAVLTWTFRYPDEPYTRDSSWLQFKHEVEIPDSINVDDSVIGAVVDGIVDRLATTDPKSFATVCGGKREHAEALGYQWPSGR